MRLLATPRSEKAHIGDLEGPLTCLWLDMPKSWQSQYLCTIDWAPTKAPLIGAREQIRWRPNTHDGRLIR